MRTNERNKTTEENMQAVRIHQVGGAEGLVYEEAPQPMAKKGEVLVGSLRTVGS
jgi:hypothetical protein